LLNKMASNKPRATRNKNVLRGGGHISP